MRGKAPVKASASPHGKLDILRAELVSRLRTREGRSVLDSVDDL
jgi:hypothetical protein